MMLSSKTNHYSLLRKNQEYPEYPPWSNQDPAYIERSLINGVLGYFEIEE